MGHSALLNLIWRAGRLTGGSFVGVGGEQIEVISEGELSDDKGVWFAVETIVDGERRRGSVAVGSETTVPDGAILRVVEREMQPVLDGFSRQAPGQIDKLVPQIQYDIAPQLTEYYDTLRKGASEKRCAGKITAMEGPWRTSLFTSLLVERLKRKTGRVMEIFEAARQDWNQTFHVLLLSAMGGDRNKGAFTDLASRVTAVMISREKSSPQRVETLLLGGGGFLEPDDPRMEEFRHLAAKYSIVPLRLGEWDLTKLRPVNHPKLRLEQIAALLSKKDFMLDGMLACHNSEQVETLFMTPDGIGRNKARLVGINMVAPLMFAYGRETGAEELCDRALSLLETIPAEQNIKLAGWYLGGCEAWNAFESQALLELQNEYCATGACAECRICRSEIKKML